MKRLAEKIENMMMAITFAEAGEHETAREMMKKDDRPDKSDRAKPSKRAERVLRASAPPR
ncbi:MAG: hypothetical protein HZB33_04985 [Nitrospirae bacterium]|nr:hypothetical protein [Nitrospirota bacterium]